MTMARSALRTVGCAALVLGAAMSCGVAAAEEAKTAAASWQAQLKDVVIVPKDADATKAFAELRGKGGPRVLVPQSVIPPGRLLLVPPSLRFREVSGRELIEAVAAAHKLKVAWPRDGATAVLYRAVDDAEFENFRREMASERAEVRNQAFNIAAWMSDPRVVSLLAKAFKAADPSSAQAQGQLLFNNGWDVLLALDDSPREFLPVLEMTFKDKNLANRWRLLRPIAQVGGDSSVALLESALTNQTARNSSMPSHAMRALRDLDPNVAMAVIERHPLLLNDRMARGDALAVLDKLGDDRAVQMIEKYPVFLADDRDSYPILARVGSDKAAAILEQGLTNSSTYVRMQSLNALAQMGTDKALQIMGGALADTNESWRYVAPNAVLDALAKGNARGDKAVALIEQAMTNIPGGVRLNAAIAAMGRVGGEKATGLIIQAFTNDSPEVRAAVTAAIGQIGGEQALALLEKAGADTNVGVRASATTALGQVGGDRAWALLGKAAADPDVGVRKAAVAALTALVVTQGQTSGRKALTLLEKAIADPDAEVRKAAIGLLGQIGGDPVLTLLAKGFTDPDAGVRKAVAEALILTEAPKTRDMMHAQLAAEQDLEVLNEIANTFFKRFPGDWRLEKVVNEAQERLRQ